MNQFNKVEKEVSNYGTNLKTQEECENDLKENYTTPGHPIAFSGINNIYEYSHCALFVK